MNVGASGAPTQAAEDRPYVLPASFTQAARYLRSDDGLLRDNVALGWRLEGALDVRALLEAIAEVTRRHEALRTSLSRRGGAIVQVVHPSARTAVELTDLGHAPSHRQGRALSLLAAADAGRWFDLNQPHPLWVRLVRLGPRIHVLLVTATHAFWDAWSTAIFLRELDRLYMAFTLGRPSPLPDPSIHLGDFIVWQRDREPIVPGALERQPRWPVENLRRPALLPCDAEIVAVSVPLGSARLVERLSQLASSNGTTLSTALLGGAALALRHVVRSDVAEIAVLDANRDAEESQGILGCLVNYVFVQISVKATTFVGLLRGARGAVAAARADTVSLERLFPSAERAFSHHGLGRMDGLFDIVFNDLLVAPFETPSRLGQLAMKSYSTQAPTELPADAHWHRTKLSVNVVKAAHGGVSVLLLYRTDCLLREEVTHISWAYRSVLQWGARYPDLLLPGALISDAGSGRE